VVRFESEGSGTNASEQSRSYVTNYTYQLIGCAALFVTVKVDRSGDEPPRLQVAPERSADLSRARGSTHPHRRSAELHELTPHQRR
jgi:hypothetical protein